MNDPFENRSRLLLGPDGPYVHTREAASIVPDGLIKTAAAREDELGRAGALWAIRNPEPRKEFETLGDLAKVLERAKADGFTVEAVRYVIGQVWWE